MDFRTLLETAAGQPSAWTPLSLGASLILWWDAEDAGSMSMTGAHVEGWTDKAAGFAAENAAGSDRPTFSDTAVNGRPGVVFDGIDDFLTNAGTPSRVAAGQAREWWFLGTQTRLSGSATTGRIFRQGAVNINSVQQLRTSGNGVTGIVGDGASQISVALASGFEGVVITRQQVTASDVVLTLNGSSSASAAVVPSLSNELFYMGTAAGVGSFHEGAINTLIQTEPLSDAQAAQMLAYLKFRGGVA